MIASQLSAMAPGFTDLPTAGAFALVVTLLGTWLAHRLAVAGDKKKPIALSMEEKNVLIAAAKTGRILLMRVDIHGEWVRAGESDFIQTEDPAFAARHLEAFRLLINRGLVISESGAFRLSGTGFEVARRLLEAQPTENSC